MVLCSKRFSRAPASNASAPGDNQYVELAIRIHVEQLPEGVHLATSDELPGLVAQGRTVAEALEIARDFARKLIEARCEREGMPTLSTTGSVTNTQSWLRPKWGGYPDSRIAR